MKKKISKLSINKTSISNLSAANLTHVKGGTSGPLCELTEAISCESPNNCRTRTESFSCFPECTNPANTGFC